MFRRQVKRLFLLWLGVSSFASALATTEVRPDTNAESRYRIAHWTSEDGLPANRVSALAQTHDGYLWVGTWFGLARFDGVRFTVFNRYNVSAMVNDAINALAVDREANLWIGTADGLLVLREGRFQRFTQANGLPDPKVWRLISSAAGGIWMLAGGGKIVHWRKERPTFITDLQLGGTNEVRSMWENADGGLTVATQRGLRRISPQGALFAEPSFAEHPGPEPSLVCGSLIDRQRRSWLSTKNGLYVSTNGSWRAVLTDSTPHSPQHQLHQDKEGSIWINRGSAGLWRFTGDRVESINLGHRSGDQGVEEMLEDREGHLWIATVHGLYQLRAKLIRSFSTADGLPHDECWSVCPGPDDAVWVETRRGVGRIHNDRVQTFADEPTRWYRMSILMDPRGTLWLGNGGNGVVAWRPGGETNWFWSAPVSAGTSGVALEALYRDRSDRIWVGTGQGVSWFENGRAAAHWGEFGLPTNSVRSIHQTRDGTMWFGTWQSGAVRWKMGGEAASAPGALKKGLSSWTRYTAADGLADDRVFVFHEDAEGALWIGTHNGLNRFKDGRFFTFRTEHGLLDSLINWLVEDDFGRLWFSGNRGIFRIDRQELNLVADGKKTRANVSVYGTADGMLSSETNGEHQPAGCKDNEGQLWFPTTQGVVVIQPRNLKDNDVPPPVVIEEVRVDGQLIVGARPNQDIVSSGLVSGSAVDSEARDDSSPRTKPTELRIAPGRARTVQIRYTANSFAEPRRVRFRYRLAGRDESWREETEERVAYYTDLRPGKYRFELEAANPQGIWTKTPAVFAFSLAPKFTQTLWFPISCALALLGVSAGFGGWRLHWQHRLLKAEQARALADQRTRIARDLHDDLGTALTGLALELDVIRRQSQHTPSAPERLSQTAKRTRALAERMREVVWAVNPRCDTVSSLASFLEQQTAQFLHADGMRGRLEFPDDIPSVAIGAEVRHQLALAAREALTNVIRHAQATEVIVKLALEERSLVVRITDNGCGYDSTKPHAHGHGVGNLRERMERVGGSFESSSAPQHGTSVVFRVPLHATPGSNGENHR